MEGAIILLGTSFLLMLILLVLILVLTFKRPRPKSTKEDLRKIKEQIMEEE